MIAGFSVIILAGQAQVQGETGVGFGNFGVSFGGIAERRGQVLPYHGAARVGNQPGFVAVVGVDEKTAHPRPARRSARRPARCIAFAWLRLDWIPRSACPPHRNDTLWSGRL